MSQYANKTSVSVEKSRYEIERTLQRYGADRFAYASEDGKATIGFEAHARMIRFDLALPPFDDYALTETGRARSRGSQQKAWEQACRQRWRALALVIKAKLEAVESGITTFEVEFMAHTLVPTKRGSRVFHEVALPQLAESYQTGKPPALLLGTGG